MLVHMQGIIIFSKFLIIQHPCSTNESIHIKMSCVLERADDSSSIAEIVHRHNVLATLLGFLTGLIVMHLCSRKMAEHSLAAEGQAKLPRTHALHQLVLL